MASKREYLIDLNLAKPGRGRFSRAALDALAKAEAEGVVFDEPVTVGKVAAPASTDASDHRSPGLEFRPEPGGNWRPLPPETRVRDIRAMYATDDDGRELMFMTCMRCGKHVSFCKCQEIGLPYGATRLLDKTDLLGV